MAQQVFGPSAVVSVLNRAFTNTSPSNAVFANQVAAAGTTDASQLAFAKSFGASYATGKTAADLSALLLTNIGVANAALATALTDYIAANGTQNVGIIAWQLSSILSNLENDATYGAAAKAWNAEVTAAYEYSANPKNTTPSTGTTTGNEAGTSTVLTTAQDVVTGSVGNDFFRGVAGQPVGNQEQSTFNSSDIIDGGAGVDTLILNLVGNYNGGARVKNVETLQLGVNAAIAAAFDYNVNAGFNEISEVTKVTADQINAGETLTVNNVVRATAADGARTMPTISWVNDNATTAAGQAGVVNFNYRAAELIGAADTQNVELQSVSNGQLNVSAGVETINLKSLGTERVTLQVSANADAAPNNVGADLISTGTLAKVILSGTAEIGKAAGIQAVTGLTDRVVGVDTGITGVPLTAAATASNLLSVDARVTEVDASAATAAVNVRFLAKTTGAETNVTFKGGAGNDYVEFEVGNITATGAAGDDTFAFINNSFNSTLTTVDSIDGGAGTDSIQLGLNGVGNYDLQWTEFNSKTGIDVLDLRGATNKVELSDAFVAAADAGLTVRTDKIVQTSAASVANPAGGSVAEDASVNTILLTKLAANRAITFEGGSGSDRLVLNEQSFTSNATLRGGDNINNAGPAVAAVAGDYDTLTVVDNAVLSRGDLSKTAGFEGLNLVKSDTTSSRQFSIELTEAFLLANTQATDNLTLTNIDDRAFQIGSVAAANANALNNLDTVVIDVTDLYNTATNTLKATLAGRYVDLVSLNASGAAVRFTYNGQANLTLAQLGALVANAVVNTADAGGTANVLGGVAVPVANNGITFASGIGQQNVLGTNNNDTFTLSQADTVTGGTGTDTVTFNAGSAAANVTLGGGADTVNLNVALTGTLNMAAGGTVNIDSNLGGAFNLNTPTVTFGAPTTVNVRAAQTGAITNEDGAGHTLSTTVGGTFTLGTGGQTFTSSGTGNVVANGGTGDDTLTLSNTGTSTVTGGAGIDTINITAATGVTTVVVAAGAGAGAAAVTGNRDVVTGFNATNDVIGLVAVDTVPAGAAGSTPVVQAVAAAGALALANTADVVVLNFDIGGTTAVLAGVLDGSALLANLGGALTTTAATDIGYIVAYDNGNAYVYSYDANLVGVDVNVTANEIALIGTFNGVATSSLGVANFALV